jgi:hypothetical protein
MRFVARGAEPRALVTFVPQENPIEMRNMGSSNLYAKVFQSRITGRFAINVSNRPVEPDYQELAPTLLVDAQINAEPLESIFGA